MLKRYIISIITILSVLLCACGTNVKKTEAYITLRVTINPEFEIALDKENVVTSINTLNEDAKVLFSDIDVVGTSYDAAMTLILDTAFEKDYITSETDEIKIELKMQESLDKAAMEVLQEMFEKPIVTFKEEKQLSLDVTSLEVSVEKEEKTEEETTTSENEPFRWEPNSTYEMPIVDPNTKKEIGKTIEYYDEEGLLFKEEHIFNYGGQDIREYYKDGTMSRLFNLSAEGNETEEYYDKDGNRISTKVVYANGCFSERTYYSNGNVKFFEEDSRKSGGNYSKESFREDGTVIESSIIYADGSSVKIVSYENGNRKSDINEFADGLYLEHHYFEDGSLMISVEKSPDGIYHEQEYYSNGQSKHSVTDCPDYYSESRYDENGEQVYSYYNDGTMEYLIENGKYIKYKDENGEITDSEVLESMSHAL